MPDAPSLSVTRYRSYARNMPTFGVFMTVPLILQAIVFWRDVPWWRNAAPMLGYAAYGIGFAAWWSRHCLDHVSDETADRRLRWTSASLEASAIVLTVIDATLFDVCNDAQRVYMILQNVICCLTAAYFQMLMRRTAMIFILCGAVAGSIGLIGMHNAYAPATILFLIAALVATWRIIVAFPEDLREAVAAKLEAQRLGELNTRLANLDMVTGLPNRREFFRALHAVGQRDVAGLRGVHIGVLDLDGFKSVNDAHGHLVGDRVLAAVAQRVAASLPDDIRLFRLGGDEFGVIVTRIEEASALVSIGKNAITAACRPVQVDRLMTSVGCSIGFSGAGDSARSADELCEQADFALYSAKHQGRGRTVLFSSEHASRMRENGHIQHALRHADVEAELHPVFQPVVDSVTGRIVSFESLARWRSPVLGDIPPSTFIPVAEHAGLISAITVSLLRKTLEEMRRWPEDISVSFNLSSFDISNAETIDDVLRIVEESGIEAARIGFELTETALLNNYELSCVNIVRLRHKGIRVALDDFGTGCSSLSHVNLLPLDRLKIDRSFVVDIETRPNSQKIVELLTQLCAALQIECVVEGVETPAQIDILRRLGCRLMQGYVYARPVSSAQAAALATQTQIMRPAGMEDRRHPQPRSPADPHFASASPPGPARGHDPAEKASEEAVCAGPFPR